MSLFPLDTLFFLIIILYGSKRFWDGTNLSQVTAFNSTVLAELPSTVKPDKVYSWRERLVWGFSESSGFKSLALFSKQDNGDDYTGGASVVDAFFEYVNAGDNEGIKGFVGIKRNNASEQEELLLAVKKTRTYQASEIVLFNSVPVTTFNRLANDIGVINQECIINFANDVYLLNSQGLGSFGSATNSGGVDASTYEAGIRINPLIQESSLNSAFENSFALHCPQRQLIWFFMPASSATSEYEYGYTYPETPMSMTIGFSYGVMDKSGQAVNNFYTFLGPGWGWSCACVYGKEIFLGSYNGDIYKFGVGDEFERDWNNLSSPCYITSSLETGDLVLENGVDNFKSLKELFLYWHVDANIQADITVFWNSKNEGKTYFNKNTNNILTGGVYGSGLYGASAYAFPNNANMYLSPTDAGRSVRLKIDWLSTRSDSLGNTVSNHGAFWNYSGKVDYNGKYTRV